LKGKTGLGDWKGRTKRRLPSLLPLREWVPRQGRVRGQTGSASKSAACLAPAARRLGERSETRQVPIPAWSATNR
jgi:hypothetical protein